MDRQYRRLERVIQLISFLHTGPGYNTAHLARELKVSRRTVFRDLEALRASGILVFYDESEETYELTPSARLLSRAVTDEDILLLVFAAQLSLDRLPTTLRSQVRKAMANVTSGMGDELWSQLSRLLAACQVDYDNDWSDIEATIDLVLSAARLRRQLRVTYQDAQTTAPLQTKVAPYRVQMTKHRWQLIGRSSLHRGVYQFDLRDISDAEVLEESFTIPRGYYKRTNGF